MPALRSALLFVAFACAAAADTISLTRGGEPLVLDATRTSPFSSLWGRETTELRRVAFLPQRPRAGRPVEVTVETFVNRRDTDLAETSSVEIVYTTGEGATWKTVALQRVGEQTWRGRIPAQPRGTKVLFYARARDNFGNVTTELPSDSAPRFVAAEDAADPDELVPAPLDLLETHVGRDAEHLYIKQILRGKLSGSLAPHLYLIALLNPDDRSAESFTDAPALAYLPMGQALKLPTSGLFRMDRVFRNPNEAAVAGADVKLEVDAAEGRAVTFSFKRAALGENPSGFLRLVPLTLNLPDLRRPATVPWDAAPFTTVYFRSHSYVVE